jgi:hypothetical protein
MPLASVLPCEAEEGLDHVGEAFERRPGVSADEVVVQAVAGSSPLAHA